jgi:hypothetical protein
VSFRAVEMVLEHSQAKGNQRLVLVVVAECADHNGENAYPSTKAIMHRTGGLDRATVYRLRDQLREMGELDWEVGAGPNGENRYRLPIVPNMGGSQNATGGSQDATVANRDGRTGATHSVKARPRGSSDPSLRPLTGAGTDPHPPSGSPAARARQAGDERDRKALDALPAELRPFVAPVRDVLARIAAEKPGAYVPTAAAVCSALTAFPRKDFLPTVLEYEHWALHGRGQASRVKDVVRQWRRWIEKEPDVLRPTGPGAESPLRRREPRNAQSARWEDAQREAAERPPTPAELAEPWDRLRREFLTRFDQVPFAELHVRDVGPVQLTAGRLVLWAPTSVRGLVENRYRQRLATVAAEVWPEVSEVEIVGSDWRPEEVAA